MLIFRAVLHFGTSLINVLIVLTLIPSVFDKFLKLSELIRFVQMVNRCQVSIPTHVVLVSDQEKNRMSQSA